MRCWDPCQKESQITGFKLARAFGDIVMNSLIAHNGCWSVRGRECLEGSSGCWVSLLCLQWWLQTLSVPVDFRKMIPQVFKFPSHDSVYIRKPENFCGEAKRHLSLPEFCDNLSEQSETKFNCMGHWRQIYSLIESLIRKSGHWLEGSGPWHLEFFLKTTLL